MAREQKAKIEYRNANGEKVKVTEKPSSIVFVFANKEQALIDVAALRKEQKDVCQVALIRGLAEKVRDTYAGAETVEEAFDLATDMIGRLEEGEWMSAREGGGPRMTMLLAAIKEVLERHGRTFDLEASRAKYVATDEDSDEVKKAKAEARRNAAANAEVAVVLERLKSEAAARRVAKAPTTATETDAL